MDVAMCMDTVAVCCLQNAITPSQGPVQPAMPFN